jgi:hypothetical protein
MFLEATTQIASRITNAIRDAARATGASFEYLLKTALRESNLDPAAKATTSSATGLFQFVDQTWLETVKHANPALGYSRYADAIVQTSSGRYVVPDPAMRNEILQLRNDPSASAAMAAAFTHRNAEILTARLGRKPTDGELYLAHFLGPSGAGQLITAAFAAPQTKAADLFPDAARANRSIFYSRTAGPRSAAQVYALLTGKHDRMHAPHAPAAGVQIAAASAPAAIERAVSTAAASPRDAEPVTPVNVPAFAPEDGPVFHSLFHTSRRGAVSLVVSELWGAKSVQFPDRIKSAPVAAPSTDAAAAPARPLDLFQFLRPEITGRARRSA